MEIQRSGAPWVQQIREREQASGRRDVVWDQSLRMRRGLGAATAPALEAASGALQHFTATDQLGARAGVEPPLPAPGLRGAGF